MPNNSFTKIAVILDRSGSMSPIAAATVEGLNKYIADQQKEPGTTEITIVQFDHEYEVLVADADIKTVKPLTMEQYQPRGMTALLDSIGKQVNDLGKKLAAMPEAQRPGNVIVVIITDGAENASKEFGYDKIQSMIKHQESMYSWTFTFLGANIDVAVEAQKLGVQLSNSQSYASTHTGVKSAFMSASVGTSRGRAMRMTNMGTGSLNDFYANGTPDDFDPNSKSVPDSTSGTTNTNP